MIDVRVDLGPVMRRLDRLAFIDVPASTRESLRVVGGDMVRAIRATTPVDTGTLKRNIGMKLWRSPDRNVLMVLAGPVVRNAVRAGRRSRAVDPVKEAAKGRRGQRRRPAATRFRPRSAGGGQSKGGIRDGAHGMWLELGVADEGTKPRPHPLTGTTGIVRPRRFVFRAFWRNRRRFSNRFAIRFVLSLERRVQR